MLYEKTIWQDRVVDPETGEILSPGTPISANNLNKIENGLESISISIGNKIHSMVNDINKMNFELKINNYITSENMKHVFVDTIDSASDVVLTAGMFNGGKVYI